MLRLEFIPNDPYGLQIVVGYVYFEGNRALLSVPFCQNSSRTVVFPPMSDRFSLTAFTVAIIATCAVSLAQSDPAEPILVHWRFEGTPGDSFSGDKSEGGECAVSGQVGKQAPSDTRPVYGVPAPDAGGLGSLLLGNKHTSDNDGAFAVSDALKDMAGMSGVTVEAWINPATIKESMVVRSVGQAGEDQLLFELKEDGSFCFQVTHAGTDYAVVSPPGIFSENEWHHVAGVFGPKGLYLYVDGRLVAQRQKERVPWPDISGSFGRLGIGACVRKENLESVGHFFDGQIDEIRIIGRELAPAEFLSGGSR